MREPENNNPVRELRGKLGMSQVEFAHLIGRSMQSVRAYERHPEDITEEVVERLKTVAVDHGYADLALRLSSDDWRVRRVFEPGEIIFTSPPSTQTGYPYLIENRRYHDLLEKVLNSRKKKAIDAVIPNLELFGDYVDRPDVRPLEPGIVNPLEPGVVHPPESGGTGGTKHSESHREKKRRPA